MKKVVRKLRQEVKLKVNNVTSDDIKIYYTGKFQDFTARYMIKFFFLIYQPFLFNISPIHRSFWINSLCDTQEFSK